MKHKPIQLKDLSLFYTHKTCFEDFTSDVHFGERIALIGRNGSGKSTLLKMLGGLHKSYSGDIHIPSDVHCGYLPQVIDNFHYLSGGQRLNEVLTQILSKSPNLLLLDEPTNHLDSSNRRSLLRLLEHYPGTLIIATHDPELINVVTETLWHIESGKIAIFKGSYFDYQQMLINKKNHLEQELSKLSHQKKEVHRAKMKAQERSQRMSAQGKKKIAQRKWPTVRSHTKLGDSITTGDKRLSLINHKKEQLLENLSSIHIPKVIKPKFKLNGLANNKPLIRIEEGSVAYKQGEIILENINFQLKGGDRVAFYGDNASGKSTLIKAILKGSEIDTTGEWFVSKAIGYIDQHYDNLQLEDTVLDNLRSQMPHTSQAEIRSHLNDFLFQKNEEVNLKVKNLSGGEKARLSMALIAANPPELLILDEVTNNLDLETRQHLIEVISQFPGALIAISHDRDFLESIGIETSYKIQQGKIAIEN